MGRMRIRSRAAAALTAAVLGLAALALTTCSNPVDLVEAATVEVMKANDRYLEVVSVSPALNATNVDPGLPILLELDRSVDPDSIDTSSVVIQYVNASAQVITESWDSYFEPATNVLSILPDPYLEDTELYTVTVSGLRGADGSGMLAGRSWSFTTGVAPKGSIEVTSTYAGSQAGYTNVATVVVNVVEYSNADEWYASSSPITTIDGSLAWKPLAYVYSPMTLTSPAQGVNRIYAVFRNSGTAAYGSETYKQIIYDTIAPSTPSVPDLATADDTGYSSTDNITRYTSGLTFAGTADSATTVDVRTAGTSYGTVAVSKFGTWSVDLALASGSYTLYAQAVDRAGNQSPASSTVVVTVDTTAPAAPSVPDLAAADDTGMSSTDNKTYLTTGLTFSGTGSIASNRIYLNNGSTDLTYVTETDANWSMDISLAQGTHTIRAINEDTAGNRGASGYVTVVVDTTAPTVSVFTAGSGNPSSTNSPNVTLYITASDSGSGLYQSHYGNYLQPWSAWETYATTKAWTLEDKAGIRRVYIQVTDYAGNTTGQIYDEIILNARITVTFSQIYLTNDGDVDILGSMPGEIYYYLYVDGVLRFSRPESSYLSISSPATIPLTGYSVTIYENPTSGSFSITGTVYDDDSPSSDDYGTLAAITYSAPFSDVPTTYRTFGLVNSGEDVEGRLYYSIDFENQ